MREIEWKEGKGKKMLLLKFKDWLKSKRQFTSFVNSE